MTSPRASTLFLGVLESLDAAAGRSMRAPRRFLLTALALSGVSSRGSASRAVVIAGALAVLLALGAVELTSAAPIRERAGARPALRLVRVQPFTVLGTGFKPRERVRVTVVREDRTVVRARGASAAGRFVVSFRELEPRRCAASRVKATGVRGSRAILKLAQPACAPD